LFRDHNEDCFQRGTKTAAAGWRFVAGAVRRECNVQNSFGYVDRNRWRDRNLSSRFVVVRFGLGDGLGRDGLLGKKSDLAAPQTF
jgi:hypothetical protein